MAQLSGLLRSAFAQPDLHAVLDADLRPAETPALRVEGPSALRPFLAAALAAERTVLVVTATDREAEDLGAAAADLIDPDTVAVLPSWETLPHERLSPRPDTVGRRLTLFRRLATDDAPRVLVAAARSLIQPIAPGLGALDPVRLRVGDEHDFDALLVRLVELAYTRVEMVTARGEFAVRGGIVDIFPPTAEHPVRVEFWGDEVSELRAFTVADQRSTHPVDAARRARLPRAAAHRPGPREAPPRSPAPTRTTRRCASCSSTWRRGFPREGMESLIPALVAGELQLLTDLLPDGALVLVADPERVRTRSADLVRTGQEFLEASWFAAAAGRVDSTGMGGGPRSTSAPRPTATSATSWSTPPPPDARW